MNRLSSPIDAIAARYDVIVVGSGYGGAIAASRLARAGKRVCVLERGKERQPGEFPATSLEAAEELQLDLPEGRVGSRTGLYDLRVNRDISVVLGCGLGGTSLINAGVSIRPDARVLGDPRWPAALRDEGGRRLGRGFELAEQMLGTNPYPADRPPPPKLVALRASAAAIGRRCDTPPINVTFTAGHNHAGVWQRECVLCGDCVSGCNHGAKNSVLMNYLPDAKRHGAELYVETSVRWVEPAAGGQGGWTVHFQALNTGREAFDAPTLFVTAEIVILAAGSLGSAEILLRSRDAGQLQISDRIGHGFSGNGDVLAFGYNCTPEIRSVGLGPGVAPGAARLAPALAVGPTITGVIDMRGGPERDGDMLIEEGVIPGVIAPLLPAIQALAGQVGTNTAPDLYRAQQAREAASLTLGAYQGATLHTQTYLVIGHDGSDGSLGLDRDRVRIRWPGIGSRPIIATMNQRVAEVTRPLEGIFLVNPLWSDILGKSLVTVHPIGGCNMADSAEHGVVDHAGKVFSASAGTAVHDGLYVCDGAILPSSVGVNPLLMISALAERCCMIMAEERGFTIDYSAKGPIPADTTRRPPGIRFTEAMKGWFAAGPAQGHVEAAAQGEALGRSFEFIVTIASPDVHAMIKDDGHEARMVGTVRAPYLSTTPLVVTDGRFNLFVTDPAAPGGHMMKYRMRLSATDGRTYYVTGFKTLRDRPFWEVWHDATTLYITIHEGIDAAGPVVGTGVLEIAPADLIRLLATLDVTDAASARERAAATVAFGRLFAGALYDHYGGLAVSSLLGFDAEGAEPPRKRRPLRVSAPQFLPLTAADGATILLTRHCGGARGPVILAHAPDAASSGFALDTVDTNLLEYLHAAGHDVWLLDDRSSALLPEPRPTSFAGVAEDLALAAAAVLEATGNAAVRVLAQELDGLAFATATALGVGAPYARMPGATPELDTYPRILAQLEQQERL